MLFCPSLSARACSALELTTSVNLLFHDKKHFDKQLGGRGKGRGRTRGWKWQCSRPGVPRSRYRRVLAGSSSVLSAQSYFQRGRSRPWAATERAPQRAPAAVLPGYGLRCGPGPLPAAWCLVPGLPQNISTPGGRRAGGNSPLPVCGSPVPTVLHPPDAVVLQPPCRSGPETSSCCRERSENKCQVMPQAQTLEVGYVCFLSYRGTPACLHDLCLYSYWRRCLLG